MEEKFLKNRQEREEQRQNRAKEVSDVATQRQQFDHQTALLTAHIEEALAKGDATGAQSHLNELRTLIMDTANTVSLTGHEMAKANNTLAHLQQLVDDAVKAAPAMPCPLQPLAPQADTRSNATTVAEGSTAEQHESSTGGARRFKFSKKVKQANGAVTTSSSPATAAAVAVASRDPTTSQTEEVEQMAAAGAHGATYGPATGQTIFIAHSTAAFVSDCVDCLILAVPISGSVFVSNCRNCRLYVCCHQLRMKNCHNVSVYVWCASTPIIEHCDEMCFGSYECWRGLLQLPVPPHGANPDEQGSGKGEKGGGQQLLDSHAKWAAELGDMTVTPRLYTSFEKVDDFQWLKKTASPNWRLLSTAECVVEDTVFPSV